MGRSLHIYGADVGSHGKHPRAGRSHHKTHKIHKLKKLHHKKAKHKKQGPTQTWTQALKGAGLM